MLHVCVTVRCFQKDNITLMECKIYLRNDKTDSGSGCTCRARTPANINKVEGLTLSQEEQETQLSLQARR